MIGANNMITRPKGGGGSVPPPPVITLTFVGAATQVANFFSDSADGVSNDFQGYIGSPAIVILSYISNDAQQTQIILQESDDNAIWTDTDPSGQLLPINEFSEAQTQLYFTIAKRYNRAKVVVDPAGGLDNARINVQIGALSASSGIDFPAPQAMAPDQYMSATEGAGIDLTGYIGQNAVMVAAAFVNGLNFGTNTIYIEESDDDIVYTKIVATEVAIADSDNVQFSVNFPVTKPYARAVMNLQGGEGAADMMGSVQIGVYV